MLYESYKNKLEKRKRRFERFWRFRLLYLALLLMLLAFAGAMMGVAGTVTEVVVPAQFTYGEPLSMQASTVFGGADFEYRPSGAETWSSTLPRAAGTYECRAVGTSVAGTDRPSGKIFSFTIAPVETVVRVREADLMYGDKPTFAANLCYDDVLQVGSYEMEEEDGVYHIVADLDAVSILSADGEDVTASYALEVAARDVNEVAREITVHTASATAVYNGQPLSAEEWEIVSDHGLAEGHHIDEVTFGSITDAGTKVNACEYRILDENNEDVTERYTITEDFGNLTVTPRPVTVTTESETRDYDGKEHTYEIIAADAETPLAEGQSLRRAAPLSAKNAGEYPNAPAFDIVDAEGNSTKGNYQITEAFGSIVIKKVAITVTMTPDAFTYDGTVHEYNTEEWYTLTRGPVEGERLEFSGTLSVRDADTYLSNPTVKVFAEDAETSENYDLEVIGAEVIVNRRPLYVTTASDRFTYDGKAHTYDVETLDFTDGTTLADGQQIRFTGGDYSFTAANEDGYTNDPAFAIFADGVPVTANYEIETQKGTVVILRRALTVKTLDETRDYDGAEHTYDDIEAVDATTPDDGLAEGQTISRSNSFTWRKAGTYDNTPEFDILDGAGNSTKSNYNITEDFGKVNIQKIVVTVTTRDDEFTYDGKEHTYSADMDGAYTLSAALADGETVRYSANVLTVQSAGTYDNEPTIEIFAGGVPVTENYDLTPVYGTVTVDQISIKVTAKSETFDYDGKPHIYGVEQQAYTLEGTLAEGQELRFDNVLTAQKAGTYPNTPTVDVYAGGVPVTENYKIEKVDGTVVINKIKITVTMEGDEFIYDGTAHEYNTEEWYSVEGEAVDGERLEFSDTLSARDAKTYSSNPTVRVFSAEEETTGNYDLEVIGAEVIVNRRPLYVTTASDSFTYDGTEHTYDVETLDFTDGTTLADGQQIRFTGGDYSFTAANEEGYTNNPAFAIFADGVPVTENYDIQMKEIGTITILRRPVMFRTHSTSAEYDAQPHSAPDFDDVEEGEFLKLAAGHRLEATYPTRTVAGEQENRPTEFRILRGETEIDLSNYKIEWECGTLTITRRTITLQAGSYNGVYDGTPHGAGKDKWVDAEERLVAGHYADAESYDEYIAAGTYTNRPQNPKIYDANGEPVTDNYDVVWEDGSIDINKRQVKLQTGSDTVTYDAKPHSVMTYKDLGSEAGPAYYKLVEGHTLTVDYASITNVLDSKAENNKWTKWHIFDGEADVTDNYDIKWEWGTITIQKRLITITARSSQWIYDGDEHSESEYDVEAFNRDRGLAEGHVYAADVTAPKIINVRDSCENKLTYSNEFIGVKADSESRINNCIENYAITYADGKVTITLREITVTTASDRFTYDGQEHTYNSAEVTSETQLAKTEHGLVLTGYHSFTEANDKVYINEMTVEVHADGTANGADITENYKITHVWGTVKIDRRPIEVRSQNAASHVYDGISWREEYENCKIVYPQDMPQLEGHEVSIQYIKTEDMANVGTHDIEFTVTITANGVPVTENYVITQTPFGTVTITKRPLHVKMASEEFTYDGTEHTYGVGTLEINKGTDVGLAVGQEIRFTGGEDEYIFIAANENGYTNNPAFAIFAGEENVTANYEITPEKGTITIHKRPIEITTQSQQFIYDGTAHAYDKEKAGYIITEKNDENYGLLRIHTLTVSKAAKVTNVNDGVVANELEFEITDEHGDSVTENYDIQRKEIGTISVAKRQVKLLTGSDSVVYDGKLHAVAASEYSDWGNGWGTEGEPYYRLAAGHILVPEYPKYINASYEEKDGKYVNRPTSFAIICDGTEIDLGNYEIEWAYGTLEILRRQVKLQTLSDEFIYDAKPHSVKTYKDWGNEAGSAYYKLVEGHTLTVDYASITNVLDSKAENNKWTKWHIFDGEADVTGNYEITWEWGTITITPRPVKITTGSKTFIYDGEYHSDTSYTVEEFNEEEETGILPGHTFTGGEVLGAACVKDVSYDENGAIKRSANLARVTNIEVTAGEDDVTANYVFVDHYSFGSVGVAPRPVAITTHGGEFVYDGQVHSVNAYTAEEFDKENERGLVTGHTITQAIAQNTVTITDVGVLRNSVRFSFTIRDARGENVSPVNYTFEYSEETDGVLTITPRPIKVVLKGGTWVYCGTEEACENFTLDYMDYAPIVEEENFTIVFHKFLNAATYTNDCYKNSTVITLAGADVTRNFEISYDNSDAEVIITKRPVTITSKGGTWAYDEGPHAAEFEFEMDNGEGRGLLEWHAYTVTGKEVTDITDIFENGEYVMIGYEANAYTAITIEYNGESVLDNYEIVDGDLGSLRVKSPIYVYLASRSKEYDGTPYTYDAAKQNFRILRVPAGAENWDISITLRSNFTEIGSLTAAEVQAQSEYIITDGEGNNITAENRVVFIGGNYKDPPTEQAAYKTVLTVTQRSLSIHTRDVTIKRGTGDKAKDYSAAEDTNTLYYLTFNTLLSGHKLQCTMTGKLSLTEKSAKNELLLENVKVFDGDGNDVTKYYNITIEEGTLSWLEESDEKKGGTGNAGGGISGISGAGGEIRALPPENKK